MEYQANCKYCHSLFWAMLHAASSTCDADLISKVHGVKNMTSQSSKACVYCTGQN